MKKRLSRLSEQYTSVLRIHLKKGHGASLQRALTLGRQAVVLGLETLELARIHEQALVTLELTGKKNGLIKRAEIFFTEANTPIVETHRAARQTKVELNRLNESLNRRTLELASSNRQLQLGIERRKGVEAELKKSEEHYARLLKDSLKLQENLRQLTHRVLAGQENERGKISRELQNEIAQTLLGINVRLLTLKQGVRYKSRGLKSEIASTQRLVTKSSASMQRVARKLKNQ